jgi:hypothetical protein
MVFGSGENESRIYVSPKAVVEDQSGVTFVYLAQPTSENRALVVRRAVEPGDLTSEGLEIQDGLREGERVITAGIRFLSEGMEVRLDVTGE